MKIAITGHRPEKLGGYRPCMKHKILKGHMEWNLKNFQQAPINDIILISGCALGIDQWWMETGIKLNLPVIAAVPFKGFDSKWPISSQKYLQELLDKCQEVKYICEPGYAAYKLQKRNEWMVDNCDLLIAYWDGSSGGTKNCWDYAVKQKKDLIRVDPNELVGSI